MSLGFNMARESVKKDKMKRTSGGKEFNVDENVRVIIDQANGRILINDGNDDRVLVGWDDEGFGAGVDYGVKVSQAGNDVKTCASDKLVLSSEFNMFKIAATGIDSIAGTGTGSYSTTINHNLGYIPTVLIYVSDADPPTWTTAIPLFVGGAPPFSAQRSFWYEATTTQLVIHYREYLGVSLTWYFRYYLMRETAGL